MCEQLGSVQRLAPKVRGAELDGERDGDCHVLHIHLHGLSHACLERRKELLRISLYHLGSTTSQCRRHKSTHLEKSGDVKQNVRLDDARDAAEQIEIFTEQLHCERSKFE